MIIESLIKRKAGTTVEMDELKYHFNATENEPRHLCEVNVNEHIARFLKVKEGFRVAEGTASVNSDPVIAPQEPVKTPEPEPKAPEAGTQSGNADQVEEKAPEAAAPVTQSVQAAPVASTEIDRDALLAEAKALKIKSAHLFGNEKLAAAVADAKAKA